MQHLGAGVRAPAVPQQSAARSGAAWTHARHMGACTGL